MNVWVFADPTENQHPTLQLYAGLLKQANSALSAQHEMTEVYLLRFFEETI